MRVKDALIELLAIKLYEHDHRGKWPPMFCDSVVSITAWAHLAEEDRETFRQIARGERDYGRG